MAAALVVSVAAANEECYDLPGVINVANGYVSEFCQF